MKILFWSEKFWPFIGGAETFGMHLIAEMRDRGHDVIVVTSTDDLTELPDEETYNNVPIYRFPFQRALLGKNIEEIVACQRRVARLKQTFQPDLIHLNGISASTLFHLQTPTSLSVPVVVRMNQDIFSSEGARNNTLMNTVLKTASWVVSVSQDLHHQVCRWLPEAASRSSVIYTGVPKPYPDPTPLSFEAPTLSCLGRLVSAKGFDLAVAAFTIIRQQFPDIRMMIGGDGPDRSELVELVGKYRLEDAVDFLGWIKPSDAFQFLSSATIVLIPSRYEGLPQVAIQAAMMARPIVASRVSGLPEVVQDYETGLLINKNDVQGLADAVRHLLRNPDLAMQMGRAARARALRVFDWDECLEKYENLYHRLIMDVSQRMQA